MNQKDYMILNALFERFESLNFMEIKSMGLPDFDNMSKEEREKIRAKWRDGYFLFVMMETMVDRAKNSLAWFNVDGFKDQDRFDAKKVFDQLRPAKTLLPALEKNVKYYEKKLETYSKKWDKAVQTLIPPELIKQRDDLFKVLKKNIKADCLGKPKFEFEYDYGAFEFRCKFKLSDRSVEFSQKYKYISKVDRFNKKLGWIDYSENGWGVYLHIGRKQLYGESGTEWGKKLVEYISKDEELKDCLKANLLQKAEKQLQKAKSDLEEMKALARRVNMELYKAAIEDGKAVLEFETRYPLDWEYDRDNYTMEEWREEGEKYIQSDLKKLVAVYPKKTFVVSPGGVGEGGHASFYVSKKK